MADDLRDRIAAAIRAAGREVDLNALNAVMAVVGPEVERLREIHHLTQRDHEVAFAWLERAEQAEAERDALKAATDRVQALHTQGVMPDMCKECNHVPAADCPTLRALDGPDAPVESPAKVTVTGGDRRGRKRRAVMYALVRTTPEGDERQGSPVRRTRDAATYAALVLTDNLNTPKAEAQRFAALLDRTPVGDSVRHESGYVFRIEKVLDHPTDTTGAGEV